MTQSDIRQNIKNYIARHWEAHGCSPHQRDIQAGTGHSADAVNKYLKAMISEGEIIRPRYSVYIVNGE